MGKRASAFLKFFAGLMLGFATAASAVTICSTIAPCYVDGDNGNDSNSGQGCAANWQTVPCGTAWKNIGRHSGAMDSPGAIQYVLASNYIYPNFFLQNITGTSSQHVQFIGVSGPRGAKPYVVQNASSQVGGAYWPSNIHYIDVSNFDVNNPTSLNPNGSCIFVGSSGGAQTVDHISISNMTAIGCGGSGIQTEYGDYFTIKNNLIHDNGATITNASASGISLLANCALDTLPGYHNVVEFNIIYNQSAGLSVSPGPSDGNGFISDDQDHYQSLSSTACGSSPYLGATLVAYNIAFNNQGKGFHDWASQNQIDFFYNTDWMNCTVLNAPCSVNDGDMDILGGTGHYSSGATFYKNVVVAPHYAIRVQNLVPSTGVASATCNNLDGAAGATKYDGSGAGFTVQNNISADPKLESPQASAAGANFRPTSSSPSLPGAC